MSIGLLTNDRKFKVTIKTMTTVRVSSYDFPEWLSSEMILRGWKQADLVRRSGVNSGLLSQILSSQRKPGVETCGAIARAFGMRDVDVMRRAGIADNLPVKDEAGESVLVEFYKLPEADRKFILDQMRALRRLRDEQAAYAATSGHA